MKLYHWSTTPIETIKNDKVFWVFSTKRKALAVKHHLSTYVENVYQDFYHNKSRNKDIHGYLYEIEVDDTAILKTRYAVDKLHNTQRHVPYDYNNTGWEYLPAIQLTKLTQNETIVHPEHVKSITHIYTFTELERIGNMWISFMKRHNKSLEDLEIHLLTTMGYDKVEASAVINYITTGEK